MILPDNGKVVVIDDKPSDVEELIAALSSHKIPFVYYKNEDGSDLPDEPLDNIRLIFLDLLLVSDEKASPKKVIGTIGIRLKKILKEQNGPYVLIYWSTKEEEYREALEEEFDNGLSEYKPTLMLSLSKGTGLSEIKTEITDKFKDFSLLNAFFLWESVVNKSAGDLVNEITSLYDVKSDYNKKLSGLLYHLAKSITGNEIDELENNKKLSKAYYNLNRAFIDTLENNIQKVPTELLDEIEKEELNQDAKNNFNSKLHLLHDGDVISVLQSGNLYHVDDPNNLVKKIIDGSAKRYKENIINSDPELVELDVTPACDYAQDKGYVRLLTGILVDKEFADEFKNKAFSYRLCPVMKIGGNFGKLIFDFRFIKSVPSNLVKERTPKPLYKIRNELLIDIQANLSKHINRPGFVSIR